MKKSFQLIFITYWYIIVDKVPIITWYFLIVWQIIVDYFEKLYLTQHQLVDAWLVLLHQVEFTWYKYGKFPAGCWLKKFKATNLIYDLIQLLSSFYALRVVSCSVCFHKIGSDIQTLSISASTTFISKYFIQIWLLIKYSQTDMECWL